MKFELKNVKQIKSMSEETPCFSASLHKDGKFFCLVENRGSGGPNNYFLKEILQENKNFYKTLQDIEKELAKEEIQTEFGKINNSLDMVIFDLLNDYMCRTQYKMLCKKIAFIDKNNDIYTIRMPFTPENKKKFKRSQYANQGCRLVCDIPYEKIKKYL